LNKSLQDNSGRMKKLRLLEIARRFLLCKECMQELLDLNKSLQYKLSTKRLQRSNMFLLRRDYMKESLRLSIGLLSM